ncbi:MAG: GTP-binding protein, partial [bacterium]
LLKHYQVPTLIFVNKMDIAYHSEEELLKQLQTLSPACIPFEERYHEEIAMCSDDLLEDYLTAGAFDQDHFKQAVINRQYFPCLFGSALKNQKVTDLLELLISCSQCRDVGYKQASIYKIDHDDKGERLTFIRVDGGRFHVKDEIDGEKINQIRFYQGSRYTLADEAGIGDVVALTGLKKPQAGDLLGQSIHHQSVLQPFMRYKLTLPADCDKEAMLAYLVKLGEEEPLLHLQIRNADQILISLMGEVQIEIVREMIKEATGVEVSIDEGEISYRETILAPVEGVGHFEPLRHYAEVHVLLEPLPRGSGVVVENHCMNHLSENFQRLIMTHLQEIEFIGVLTGSPITDIKLSLLGGQAHLKHTEGGDFRQATYRAVRQGLMKAQSLLLEPYAHFIVTVPSSMIGRLYFDFEDYPLETISDDGQVCILKGQAPYSFLAPYTKTLISYTKGQGRLVLSDPYYDEVINIEDVLEKNTYDPELDYDHPTGSIFCSHGAGYYVPYDQVALHMHLDYFYETKPKRSH